MGDRADTYAEMVFYAAVNENLTKWDTTQYCGKDRIFE